jgi:hypothetical protein
MDQREQTGTDAEGYQPISQDEEGNARLAGEEQHEAPNPETGVGVGMGQASSFEPEEDSQSEPDEVAGE